VESEAFIVFPLGQLVSMRPTEILELAVDFLLGRQEGVGVAWSFPSHRACGNFRARSKYCASAGKG